MEDQEKEGDLLQSQPDIQHTVHQIMGMSEEEEENSEDPSTNINQTLASQTELEIIPADYQLSPDDKEESKTDINDRTEDPPVIVEEEKATEKARGLYDTLPTPFDLSSLDQEYSQKI